MDHYAVVMQDPEVMSSAFTSDEVTEPPVVTRPSLVADLQALGVDQTATPALMVHTRMSALGHVVGGAQTVVEALLETLGPRGTLLVLTGWQDRPPYHQQNWDPELRRAYRLQCPPFDPRFAMAEREHGRVPEAVRTLPEAMHSRHPVCAFAAVGAQAGWLLADQDLDQGYGEGSPLHRLVDADGAVLLLGAPLETVTLLHLAEHRARVRDKRWLTYEMPVLVEGERTWRTIRELDSSVGALPYESLNLTVDAFEVIVADALAKGIGRSVRVAAAPSHLLPARELLDHAIAWMEHQFGDETASSPPRGERREGRG